MVVFEVVVEVFVDVLNDDLVVVGVNEFDADVVKVEDVVEIVVKAIIRLVKEVVAEDAVEVEFMIDEFKDFNDFSWKSEVVSSCVATVVKSLIILFSISEESMCLCSCVLFTRLVSGVIVVLFSTDFDFVTITSSSIFTDIGSVEVFSCFVSKIFSLSSSK